MAAGVRRTTMPLWVALAGAVLAALALTIGAGGQAVALTNCTVTHDALDSEEQAFLVLINQYRAQNGLGPLTISTNLNRAAAWMTEDLATKGYFSHVDSLGRAPYQRAIDCGYPSGAGENLAAGTTWDTAQEAFDAWKASPGHNQNMLTGYYRQIGIARYYRAGSPYGWYWATNFGATDDGTGGGGSGPTNTPTPPPTATPTMTPTPPPTATPTATPSAPPGGGGTGGGSSPTPTTVPPMSTPTPATPSWGGSSGGSGGIGSPPPTMPPTATPTPTKTATQPTKTPSPSPTGIPSPTATPTKTSTPKGGAGSLPLSPGANLVAWPGEATSPAAVFGGNPTITVVYEWDAATGTWKRYLPGLPSFLNTLTVLQKGSAYWVLAKGQAQLALPER